MLWGVTKDLYLFPTNAWSSQGPVNTHVHMEATLFCSGYSFNSLCFSPLSLLSICPQHQGAGCSKDCYDLLRVTASCSINQVLQGQAVGGVQDLLCWGMTTTSAPRVGCVLICCFFKKSQKSPGLVWKLHISILEHIETHTSIHTLILGLLYKSRFCHQVPFQFLFFLFLSSVFGHFSSSVCLISQRTFLSQ